MTNMKKFLMLLTVAAIALMCFTGCSVNITSIGLPADMQLEKGETAQLEISYGADKENAKADAIAKAAEGLALVWESDNEDVATVDENGNVTAVGGGEANITVSIKDANIQSVCKITVDVALEDIEAPEDMVLVINHEDTAELEVKLLPKDATDVELVFESSDENVATVDADGKVTAVANGECVVTVSCGDIKAETAVKVDTAPVELKVEDMEIVAGKTAQVDVAVEGEDITVGMEYSYTTGDEDVATVDENGVVTAVAAGETTITVENELGQKTTCNVVVKEAPKQTTTGRLATMVTLVVRAARVRTRLRNPLVETAAVLRLRRLPTRLRIRSLILRRHRCPIPPPMCRPLVVTMKLGEMAARPEKMAARLSPVVGRMRELPTLMFHQRTLREDFNTLFHFLPQFSTGEL